MSDINNKPNCPCGNICIVAGVDHNHKQRYGHSRDLQIHNLYPFIQHHDIWCESNDIKNDDLKKFYYVKLPKCIVCQKIDFRVCYRCRLCNYCSIKHEYAKITLLAQPNETQFSDDILKIILSY